MSNITNAESESSPLNIHPGLLKDPNFWLWSFKIVPCRNDSPHNWSLCPYVHPNEKARRRDPRAYQYEPLPCPDDKKGIRCPRGEACNYTHNIYEYWCHPKRFRTQVCQLGTACTRPICFFAHTPEELRQAETVSTAAARAGAPPATGSLLPHQWAETAATVVAAGAADRHQQVVGAVQGAAGPSSCQQQQEQQRLQVLAEKEVLWEQQQVPMNASGVTGSNAAVLPALPQQQQQQQQQQQAMWAEGDMYAAELQTQQWAACQAEGNNRYVTVHPAVQQQQQVVQHILRHHGMQGQLQLQQAQAGQPPLYAVVPGQQLPAQIANPLQPRQSVQLQLQQQEQLIQQHQQLLEAQQMLQTQNSNLLSSGELVGPTAVGNSSDRQAFPNLQMLASNSVMPAAAAASGSCMAAGAVEGITSPLAQLYSGQLAAQASLLAQLDNAGGIVDPDAAQLLALQAAGAAMSDMIEQVSSTNNLIQPSQQLSIGHAIGGSPVGAGADTSGQQQQLYLSKTARSSFSESWALSEQDLGAATAVAANSGMLPAGYRFVPIVSSSSNSSTWLLPGAGAPMSTASTSLMSVGNASAGTMATSSLGPLYVHAGSTTSNIAGLSVGSLGSLVARGAPVVGMAAAVRRSLVCPPMQNAVAMQAALQQMNISNDPYLHDL